MSYATADKDRFLHLDLNTNLVGENPVLAELDDAVDSLSLYPSRRSDPLREALSDLHGLPADAFVCSNGADAVLDIALRTLADPGDRVAYPWPGFGMYPFYASLTRLEPIEAPLGDELQVPVDDLAEAAADLIVVASPNNPTGESIPPETVLDLADRTAATVVVDEAYVDFADHDGVVDHVEDRRDLVAVRTLSKAHGLAGLRVGYAAAHPDVADRLAEGRPPFNLNRVSETLATRALRDGSFREETVRVVRDQRPRLAAALTGRGFRTWPSSANFVFARSPIDPEKLHAELRQREILVRVFDDPAIDEHVRVTVGRKEHVDRLADALDEVVR